MYHFYCGCGVFATAGAVTTPTLRNVPDTWSLFGVASTSGGYLIVGVDQTPELYSVHIASGQVEPIETREKFGQPRHVVLSELDRCVYVSDYRRHQIVCA